MSCSLWKYTTACDGDYCCGDCDFCNKEPELDQKGNSEMYICSPWEDRKYPAFVTVDNYANNNRIAVEVWIQEEPDFAEPWASLTVNVDQELSEDGNAFIDTNNFPDAEEFITKYHLGKPTGFYGFSGFCAYPEYKLDLEELDKATAEEAEGDLENA